MNYSTDKMTENPQKRHFTDWCSNYISDAVVMIIIASVIGILCGAAAFGFKWLISLISGIFMPHIADNSINWWLIGVPIVGILLTGILTRYIFHDNPSHGTAQIINALNRNNYELRPDIIYAPVLASSITLGMGGTSGSEGPIAYTGAAIGSNLGRWLGVKGDDLKALMGCGMCAGIAGIFIAPIGGVLFGLEVVRIKISTKAVLAVFAACIASFLTALFLNGYSPDMYFSSLIPTSSVNILTAALLGIGCGIYSLYYSGVMGKMDIFFKKIKSPWISNIIGGMIIGLCLLLFPSMYCVGYPIIGDTINGNPEAIIKGCALQGFIPSEIIIMLACVGILLLKCWGVCATNSSGGVGGDFAPTLFAGCMAGYLFAASCNTWFDTQLPTTLFAFLGMAGVMSGAIEAPLMSIFIVLEMSRGYEYALPVVIVAVVSYITVQAGKKASHTSIRMIRHYFWFHGSEGHQLPVSAGTSASGRTSAEATPETSATATTTSSK
ncbi:MAG: chloride channel protein [Bacteroides sp.]|nr:chloride channel protein [Bacteroides sp.]